MAKWKGTTVPNTGYVKTLYGNTKLSVDEVVAELEKLTLTTVDENAGIKWGWLIFPSNTSGDYGDIMVECVNIDGTPRYTIANLIQDFVIFISAPKEGVDFVGWNPIWSNLFFSGFPYETEVRNNFDLLGTTFDAGTENDKITSLFSITPFEEVEENETIIKKYKVGYIDSGKGGIQFDIPAPTNLKIEEGVLTFDPVDISEYSEFGPYLKYIITVNGGADIETPNTTYNLSSVLNNGENVIEVKARVMFGFNTDSDNNGLTIQFSKPERYIYQLEAVFQTSSSFYQITSFKVDNKILVTNSNGFKIFDSTTKQISSTFLTGYNLAADENNVYAFMINSIYKFDKTTESFNTDGKEIGYISEIFTNGANYSQINVYIGNIIYFICNDDSGLYITEFNTSTLTAEKTLTISDKTWGTPPVPVVYDNTIYFFGGRELTDTTLTNNIVYRYNTIDKMFTQTDKPLPIPTHGHEGIHTPKVLVSVGDSIYLVGGYYSVINHSNTQTSKIYKFNPRTSDLYILGSPELPYTLSNFVTGTVVNDIIYVFQDNSRKILEIKL